MVVSLFTGGNEDEWRKGHDLPRVRSGVGVCGGREGNKRPRLMVEWRSPEQKDQSAARATFVIYDDVSVFFATDCELCLINRSRWTTSPL